MAKLGFYTFYIFFWLLTWLPLPVLYIISDICFVLVYYVVGYRKKVVWENLRNSFPEKTKEEIAVIQKKFYHHLCDTFVEIQKLIHMPIKVMEKRSVFKNVDYMNEKLAEGRSVTAFMSHFANWEYIPFMAKYVPHPTASIYHPLHNTYFDKFYIDIRGQYGLKLFPMKTAFRNIFQMKKEFGRYVMGFISDQAPPDGMNRLWVNFLNQDTATFLGAEKVAQKGNDVVVYFRMKKVKRGHYITEIVPISENPKELPDYELTLRYHQLLEEQIREQPELWLWSHRRWKRKRPKNENVIKELPKS